MYTTGKPRMTRKASKLGIEKRSRTWGSRRLAQAPRAGRKTACPRAGSTLAAPSRAPDSVPERGGFTVDPFPTPRASISEVTGLLQQGVPLVTGLLCRPSHVLPQDGSLDGLPDDVPRLVGRGDIRDVQRETRADAIQRGLGPVGMLVLALVLRGLPRGHAGRRVPPEMEGQQDLLAGEVLDEEPGRFLLLGERRDEEPVDGQHHLPLPRRSQGDLGVPHLPCRSEEHTSELQSPTNLVCRL